MNLYLRLLWTLLRSSRLPRQPSPVLAANVTPFLVSINMDMVSIA